VHRRGAPSTAHDTTRRIRLGGTAVACFPSFRPARPANSRPMNRRPHSKGDGSSSADSQSSGGTLGRGCFTPTPKHSQLLHLSISLSRRLRSSKCRERLYNVHRPSTRRPMSLFALLSDNLSGRHANFAFLFRSATCKPQDPAHCTQAFLPAWVASKPTGRW